MLLYTELLHNFVWLAAEKRTTTNNLFATNKLNYTEIFSARARLLQYWILHRTHIDGIENIELYQAKFKTPNEHTEFWHKFQELYRKRRNEYFPNSLIAPKYTNQNCTEHT